MTLADAAPSSSSRSASRVVRRMRDIGVARTAGSLRSRRCSAIVPLATVAFAFVARFPVFEQWLARARGLPAQERAARRARTRSSTSTCVSFTEQAARLTGMSIAVIAVTAALVIATVEREINAIWGIREAAARCARLVRVPARRHRRARAASAPASRSRRGSSRSRSAPCRCARRSARWSCARCRSCSSTPALTLLYEVVPARPVPLRARAVGGAARGAGVRGARSTASRCYVTQRADLRDRLRRARRAAGVPALDLRVLAHRAGRRGGHARRWPTSPGRREHDGARRAERRGVASRSALAVRVRRLPNRGPARYSCTLFALESIPSCGRSFKQRAGRSGR